MTMDSGESFGGELEGEDGNVRDLLPSFLSSSSLPMISLERIRQQSGNLTYITHMLKLYKPKSTSQV